MTIKKVVSKCLAVVNSMGAWLLIIVLGIVLSFATDTFFSVNNFINILRQVSVVAIIALGVSFVVLGGEIDLSTGMAATFAGCNAAIFITKWGMQTWQGILLALAVGTLVGTITGCIITFFKIPAFIGSLGVQYIIQGLILVTTNSMPISGLPDNFLALGRGYIANVIPIPAVIMLAFYALGATLLKYTPFGRSVIAVGENVEASKLSGLNVKKTKVLIFTISGFCAAVAGIVLTARLSSGQPSSGADLSLQGLAAVYIGGTFKGSMLNTLAGALAWGVVNNGLNLMGVNAYWQKVALGVVIIIAVLFDTVRAKLTESKT